MDNRASGGSVTNFFLVVVGGAALGFMIKTLVDPIANSVLETCSGSTCPSYIYNGFYYTDMVTDYWPIGALITAMFYIVVAGATERRVGQ